MKNIKIILISLFILFASLYLIFAFIFPVIVNKNFFEGNIQYKEAYVKYDGLKVKTFPLINLQIKNIIINDKQGNIISESRNLDLTANLLNLKSPKIKTEYVYADIKKLQNALQSSNKKKKHSNKTKKLPELSIKELKLTFYNSDLKHFDLYSDNLEINNNKINFNAKILSPLLTHNPEIKNGTIIFKENGFYADNINIEELTINGLITNNKKEHNLSIEGNDIQFNDIIQSVLFLQKLKKKDKVFLENFYDFKGTANIDLVWDNDGLFGMCSGNNLYAKSHLFDVPIKMKKPIFYFLGKEITSIETGSLGEEAAMHEFSLTGMGTPERTVNGTLSSKITSKFAKEYLPNFDIKGSVNLKINYIVKNKKIDVFYNINVPKESDIFYMGAYLSLRDFDRILKVHTFKDGDLMYIRNYEYLLRDKDLKQIMHGDGLLKKENGHFHLNKITWKTNGYAPTSVTGSFGQYVAGGKFKGDLSYDFETNKLLGNFTLEDSSYKDFDLNIAEIIADDKTISINANGFYDDEDFNCNITAENEFGDNKITIYNMDLFLKKYTIHNSQYKLKRKKIDIDEQIKNIDLTIEKLRIQVDKVLKDKILVENIVFLGTLKDNIFNFHTDNIKFARGNISAKGRYDIEKHVSEATLSANNIDSDIIAYEIFNLKDQIKGIASGYIHIKTKNKLDDIKAHAEFNIKDGYMPQLGSTEFLIKNSKRPITIKIKDFVSFDVAKEKALCSNINGSFDIDNYEMENINLTAQHPHLSMFLEGNYNIKTQNADIKIFGNYNENLISRIKIMFVPFSWIMKIVFRPEKSIEKYRNELKKIPQIDTEGNEPKYFRVKLKGEINDKKNMELELKRLF